MYKNAGIEQETKEQNDALVFISTEWSKKADFEEVVKETC